MKTPQAPLIYVSKMAYAQGGGANTPGFSARAFKGLLPVNNSSTASRLNVASYRFIYFFICWSFICPLHLACPLNQGNRTDS